MSVADNTGRTGQAGFTGTRRELAGILLRGFLLLVATVGIYRFWLTTKRRRFYWSSTVIDGDRLEYTGNALQLLVGFLFAVLFFIPGYGLFFYLQTQGGVMVVWGIVAIAVIVWFAMGFAIYRARDFRLSRTLWRGIRFDQGGSPWGYAWRRFGWSLLMVVTAGLIYPFMATSLWRYRYNHTWFGDRQFAFSGRTGMIAGPYYLSWFLVVIIGFVTLGFVGSANDTFKMGDMTLPGATSSFFIFVGASIAGLFVFYYRAREIARFLSSVTIGPVRVSVSLKASDMIRQGLAYFLVLVAAAIPILVLTFLLYEGIFAEPGNLSDVESPLRSGIAGAVAFVALYLSIMATLTFAAELVFGFGYWKLVANGTTLTNLDSLRTVRARAEDKALVGEGLADALNVGAY